MTPAPLCIVLQNDGKLKHLQLLQNSRSVGRAIVWRKLSEHVPLKKQQEQQCSHQTVGRENSLPNNTRSNNMSMDKRCVFTLFGKEWRLQTQVCLCLLACKQQLSRQCLTYNITHRRTDIFCPSTNIHHCLHSCLQFQDK